MLKRFALIVAAAIMIETAGTPAVAYAAEAQEAIINEADNTILGENASTDENNAVNEKESLRLDDTDYQDGYDTGESPADEEQVSPEEPQFVSPVVIDRNADIRIGEDYSRIKIAAGSTGTVDISADEDGAFADIVPFLTSRKITSSDSNVLSVNEVGGSFVYTAKGHGPVMLTVTYTMYMDDEVYTAEYECYITCDMTNVVPDKTKFVYRFDDSSYAMESAGATAEFTFTGLAEGTEALSVENAFFSYKKKGGSKLKIYDAQLFENTLKVRAEGSGKTTLIVTINGKEFRFVIAIKGVRLNKSSALLVKGKKTRLSAKNLPGAVKWTSADPRIATVKNGVVKTKKEGSALICAESGEFKLYAVINVVSKKKMSAIKKGKKIVKGKYSQAKRMRSGYYDCSSLVWRICKNSKITNFGIKWYAPVAAGEAKYLVARGKKVGAINEKNIQKRIFNPGDLYFATGRNNHRYKGIYHVEMFTGYDIMGLTSKGKPIFTCTWLNRVNGYPYFGGVIQKGFLARP